MGAVTEEKCRRQVGGRNITGGGLTDRENAAGLPERVEIGHHETDQLEDSVENRWNAPQKNIFARFGEAGTFQVFEEKKKIRHLLRIGGEMLKLQADPAETVDSVE